MASWHNFQPGEVYSLASVLEAGERRIQDGGILDVEGKRMALALLRDHAPSELVWAPFSSGWGASPFNPRCWRSVSGRPVVPDAFSVPELAD